MFSFISTFPPIMCGIGTYTNYVTSNMHPDTWSVIAFKLDESLECSGDMDIERDHRVDYFMSFDNPSLPPLVKGDLLWFQHSFGIWGGGKPHFLRLIEEGKRREKKVGASFHTIHFESEETPWGMRKEEQELLEEVLPLLDFMTVFSLGAHRAVLKAFPHCKEKVVVLRHGVHRYPRVSQHEARQNLIDYLIQQANIPPKEKKEVKRIERTLTSRDTVLVGNYGFITQAKDPLQLYKLGRLVQKRLPSHLVITLFIGKIREKQAEQRGRSLPLLQGLKSVHNGRENLFFEAYIPERIFPLAFRALDFAVFWCHNATQSGRMAHAQGTGVPIVGRKWEGIGETLELSGLPAAETLDELAEKIAEIVKKPRLKQKMEKLSWSYADQYSFYNQAKKHLFLAETLRAGMKLPVLDGETAEDLYTGKISRGKFGGFGESWRRDTLHTQRH